MSQAATRTSLTANGAGPPRPATQLVATSRPAVVLRPPVCHRVQRRPASRGRRRKAGQADTPNSEIELLKDWVFDERPRDIDIQRRGFELRKSLVRLRRVVFPMREVLNALMRRDIALVPGER